MGGGVVSMHSMHTFPEILVGVLYSACLSHESVSKQRFCNFAAFNLIYVSTSAWKC